MPKNSVPKKFWKIELLLEKVLSLSLSLSEKIGFLKEREMFVEIIATKRVLQTLNDGMARSQDMDDLQNFERCLLLRDPICC